MLAIEEGDDNDEVEEDSGGNVQKNVSKRQRNRETKRQRK